MDDTVTAVIVAVVASLPGLAAVFMQVKKNRADTQAARADAVESLSTAVPTLLNPLRDRVQELEAHNEEKTARLDMLTAYVEYLENGIHMLIGQLATNGHRATWKPLSLAEFRMQRVAVVDGIRH